MGLIFGVEALEQIKRTFRVRRQWCFSFLRLGSGMREPHNTRRGDISIFVRAQYYLFQRKIAQRAGLAFPAFRDTDRIVLTDLEHEIGVAQKSSGSAHATGNLFAGMMNAGDGSIRPGGNRLQFCDERHRERCLYLNVHACALLGSRLGEDPMALVFRMTNRRKAWEWVRGQIGRPDVRWHDLRHTHGTWLRQHGAALEVVKRSLGHTHMSTTLRYAHVAADETHEAVERLPALRDHANVVPLRRRAGGS